MVIDEKVGPPPKKCVVWGPWEWWKNCLFFLKKCKKTIFGVSVLGVFGGGKVPLMGS